MKKNKGFTLIELLAVIAILAIVLMVVVPNVLKSFNKGQRDLYDIMIKNICRASNLYFEEYQSGLIQEDDEFCTLIGTTDTCNISIQKLMNNKYLDNKLENPRTGKSIDESDVIITATNNRVNSGQMDANGVPIYVFNVNIDGDPTICNQ